MITACQTPGRRPPGRVHASLVAAHLQAASTGVPQRYRPNKAFVLLGKEGDSFLVSPDGLVRQARLYNPSDSRWSWFVVPVFNPACTALPTPADHGLRFA